jgi:hypothetical protein
VRNEAWKEVDKVHGNFLKKLIGVPSCAANGFAEMELSRETIRGKVMGLKILISDCVCVEGSVQQCYETKRQYEGEKLALRN